MTLAEFKKQFNQNSSTIHFNNSGQCPIPEVNRKKAHEWLDRFYNDGAFCSIAGWEQVEITRKKLADFIGAEKEEIAFCQTTASAISQAALSIPLKKDDEILTWDQEYPSNFYPWRAAAERAGAKLIQVSSFNYLTPVDSLLRAVNENTRVIAVSWVQFMTGAVTDLKALSSALAGKNIWLVADVIQGLGVRPFNFHESGFDIIACGSHKWLCSSFGAAFMVIKKEKLPVLQPLEYGAMTYGSPETAKSFTIPMKTTASKFEPGTKCMLEIIAFGESLDLISKTGIENIYGESIRLAEKLRIGLKELSLNVFLPHEGNIVNFSSGENQ